MPVLAVLGVRGDRGKVLVGLRLAASEAGDYWHEVLADLQRRGLPTRELLVVDGHAGLGKRLAAWPEVRVQRCKVHKGRNLAEHPSSARPTPAPSWSATTTGLSPPTTARRPGRPTKPSCACGGGCAGRWPARLEEAGEQHLTFYEFPRSMWRALRSTNALAALHRELRRRTKTQASFTTEEPALTLVYELIAPGQIQLCKNRRLL